MKIKFIQSIAGHADPFHQLDDFSFKPGDEAEIPDALADAWIESGVAQPCADLAETPKKTKK